MCSHRSLQKQNLSYEFETQNFCVKCDPLFQIWINFDLSIDKYVAKVGWNL